MFKTYSLSQRYVAPILGYYRLTPGNTYRTCKFHEMGSFTFHCKVSSWYAMPTHTFIYSFGELSCRNWANNWVFYMHIQTHTWRINEYFGEEMLTVKNVV